MAGALPALFLVTPAQAATTTAALWHMESTGTMLDSSTNGNNGTTQGVSLVSDGVDGSNAYRFDQSNSHVTVPNDASLNPGTTDFSVTTWVRFTVVPNSKVVDYDLIRKGVAGTTGGEWKVEIYPQSGSSIAPAYCLFKDATKKVASIRGSKQLATGTWHKITCAKTSSQISLMVDDGATESKTVSASLGSISNTESLGIGQKPGGGDQYVGDMDEVSITLGASGGGGGGGGTTAPTFRSGTPASNANSVGLATNVTATFSEPVQNVGSTTFSLTPDGGTAVAAAYTANSTATKWTLNPNVNLLKDHWYTVNLTTGITNTSDTPLAASASWRFLTGPAPKVSSKTPATGATGVSTATTVTATFSEPVLNVTTTTFTLTNAAGTVTATVVRSGTTNKWILTPDASLQPGTLYTATLVGGTSGITDLVGNPLKTVTWTFTTA